ncbi:MAG: hypothetical protein U0990_10030 [Candidatus Nanopelagicales bacterium]|nr:hypothetical protein [Candidatus Nanopelagicales bacterium]MDZ4250415.1 hypothetical protein [Candidatus Nanopelagicales bacterium]
MAKALFGHMGRSETRLAAEIASLRRRVRELESEVARLRADEVRFDDLESELREVVVA